MAQRLVRTSALIVAAAATLSFSACSSGGDANSAPSTADFVAGANQICRDAQARLDPLGAALFADPQPDPESLANFHATLVADLDRQLAEFRELAAPPALADDFASYLDVASEAIETVKSGGPNGLLSDADPFEEANRLAGVLGFVACVP